MTRTKALDLARGFRTYGAQWAQDGGIWHPLAPAGRTARWVAGSSRDGGPWQQDRGRGTGGAGEDGKNREDRKNRKDREDREDLEEGEEGQGVSGSNRTWDGQRPQPTPLSPLQNVLATVMASYGALRDPRRADLVSLLGETTGERALRGLLARMKDSETGRDVLRDRPAVTDAVMRSLEHHAPDTFGGAYYRFMRQRDFRADERPPVRTLCDPELAYVALRVRQVHDFWHVLFGCRTDVVGEAALKVVEFAQTGMPMTALAVLAAELRLEGSRRRLLNRVYVPWGFRAGGKSADLVTLYYEREFGRPLDELRALWRIERAPASADGRGGVDDPA